MPESPEPLDAETTPPAAWQIQHLPDIVLPNNTRITHLQVMKSQKGHARIGGYVTTPGYSMQITIDVHKDSATKNGDPIVEDAAVQFLEVIRKLSGQKEGSNALARMWAWFKAKPAH